MVPVCVLARANLYSFVMVVSYLSFLLCVCFMSAITKIGSCFSPDLLELYYYWCENTTLAFVLQCV